VIHRLAQPSIPPGSVNEAQLRLKRQRQVCGSQIKLCDPLTTRAIPERFCDGVSLWRCSISSVTYPYLNHEQTRRRRPPEKKTRCPRRLFRRRVYTTQAPRCADSRVAYSTCFCEVVGRGGAVSDWSFTGNIATSPTTTRTGTPSSRRPTDSRGGARQYAAPRDGAKSPRSPPSRHKASQRKYLQLIISPDLRELGSLALSLPFRMLPLFLRSKLCAKLSGFWFRYMVLNVLNSMTTALHRGLLRSMVL